MARQASRSGLSKQSNSPHPGHIRPESYSAAGRAGKQRRSAIGLIASIIGLGLVGLCLRTVPTVLTETNLLAQVAEPLTGIPMGSATAQAAPAAPAPTPSLSIEPTVATQPSTKRAKLQAKRRAKSQEKV